MTRVVTLGETMLRLKVPQFERLFQLPRLEATFGLCWRMKKIVEC